MPRPARVLGTVGVFVGLTAALYLLYPHAAVAYLARSIAAATTAEDETAALCQANRWVHRGLAPTYSVTARDAQGAELRPWLDGSYDRIAAVTLTWTTGRAVERTLLSREGLSCVFGE